MARINIVNADNKIDATPQRAYFKLKQTGGPRGERGETGAQGPQGATGPQGASASVVVNSTTTLPAGSDATVENIGTPQNVKLNFGIPTGPQGPQGEQGPQGAQGPQGLKGDTGARGADGAAAKVTVGNTNTGAAGTNAIVENTGSETYAVLNFTIPRGDKGETGPMPEIAQTTGQATDEVMSQKATTDALATKQNTLTAGTGITIASDTVSADTTVLATKADLNDYAPQATTYTKTETDALLAPKLEADVVASLPETGEEGKLYLAPKNYTRQTATGNPIAATVAEDAGVIESFQLDGDTFQQTYTGKNLLNVNFVSGSNRGVTITNNGDGTITAKGKTTGQVAYSIAPDTIDNLVLESGKAYTQRVEVISGTQTLRIVPSFKNSAGTVTYNYFTNNQTKTPSEQMTCTSYNIFENTTNLPVGSDVDFTIRVWLEEGSDLSSNYEPFVGGQPSPSPEFPQTIQTVMGEQAVTVVGKNLFDKANVVNGIPSSTDGSIVSTSSVSRTSGYIPVVSSTVYSHTGHPAGWAVIAWYKADKSFIERSDNATTVTSPSEAAYARVSCAESNLGTCQFEIGQPTAYTPYHTTSYPLNLGTIELCKLGTYQDYIYKDGDSWKVHKDTGNTTYDGSSDEVWAKSASTANQLYIGRAGGMSKNDNVTVVAKSDKFTYISRETIYAQSKIGFTTQTTGDGYAAVRFGLGVGSSVNTVTLFKTWLSNNPTTVYYPLSTATDTTITDSTLIAQLEAIRTAALENGTNTIANSAAGSNLAGDMEITYYGYNPTNRYDKFIWLDLNNNYEQIGS